MEEFAPVLIPALAALVAAGLIFGYKYAVKWVAGTENKVDDAVVEILNSYGGPAVVGALKVVVENTKTPYDNQLLEEVLKELGNGVADKTTPTNS